MLTFLKKQLRVKRLAIGAAGAAILLAVTGATSCSITPANVLPYIPPTYYSSTLIMPFDLAHAYWSPYISREYASKDYEGKVYVFNKFKVTPDTLRTVKKGYVWVDLIKVYPLDPANLKQLKLGEDIDVVGVLAGPCYDYANTLIFRDCVLLPDGYTKLPVGGDSTAFQYNPTY